MPTQPDKVKTATNYPIQKVAVSGAVGAFVIILVYVLHQFAGVDLPPEVVAAITTLLMFGAAYITPLRAEEVEVL